MDRLRQRVSHLRWLEHAATAPTALWAVVGLGLLTPLLHAALSASALALAGFPFALIFAVLLLSGSRVVWSLIVASGAITLLLLPFEPQPWWTIAVEIVTLACLLAPASRRFVWSGRSTRKPSGPHSAAPGPDGYSDADRPAGWYIDPDYPVRMRYWSGEGDGWSGTTKTPRKIRKLWRAQQES
jgi:hypothetical protein